MGLLKKKPTELDATAAAAILPALDPVPAVQAPAAVTPEDAANAGAGETATEAAQTDDAGGEEAAEAPGVDAGDALLSMFGSTQHESDDRAILLGMAGDVELTDLMDEVQMVASALNIAINRG
jgi:hypothetical protein